jgi:hypothetical protein
VRDVVVAGRRIVHDGVLTGIDLPQIETELGKLYKTHISRYGDLEGAWRTIEAEIARWFTDFLTCG